MEINLRGPLGQGLQIQHGLHSSCPAEPLCWSRPGPLLSKTVGRLGQSFPLIPRTQSDPTDVRKAGGLLTLVANTAGEAVSTL